jgi:hypothetical protein
MKIARMKTKATPANFPVSKIRPYLRHSGVRKRARRRVNFSDKESFLSML